MIYTRFTGAGLTIVNNSVTMILPGAANYQTIQNEIIQWLFVGAGAWVMLRSNKGGVSGALIPGYGLIADSTTRYTSINHTPVGIIGVWPMATNPTHWLECNAQAVSRTTKSKLFSVYGTFYGVGDGTTTYNLPDYREYVLVGLGGSSGRITSASVGGANVGTLGGSGGLQTVTPPSISVNIVPTGTLLVTPSALSITQPWKTVKYMCFAGE